MLIILSTLLGVVFGVFIERTRYNSSKEDKGSFSFLTGQVVKDTIKKITRKKIIALRPKHIRQEQEKDIQELPHPYTVE